MKYTKQQRAALAQAFRHAKTSLQWRYRSKKTAVICFALDDAERMGKISDDTNALAHDIISERMGLGCFSCYEDWLWVHHQALYRQTLKCDLSRHPKAYAARQAWLNSLIKEFSS